MNRDRRPLMTRVNSKRPVKIYHSQANSMVYMTLGYEPPYKHIFGEKWEAPHNKS